MGDLEYFFSTKPAYPWSIYRIGLPAFAIVAGLLILFTFWTYGGNQRVGKVRVLVILGLRLLALIVALLTALRPSVGYRENPKVPSYLLIGIDLSESMTVKDELGGQARIDAVRKTMERCEQLIEDLKSEQNVEVMIYAFGPTDFNEPTGIYDPKAPAIAKRSDYGTYLQRTLERWQGQRFIRGFLIIGDGADNGNNASAITEAGKWRPTTQIHTFQVGTQTPPGAAKDVGFADVQLDPDPVAVKTELTLRARVNAYGFAGVRVPVKVQYDLGKGYEAVNSEEFSLGKEKDNVIEMKLRAPDKLPEDANKKPMKQIKVRVEIPVTSVPGDVAPANNVVETYLNLTKEGLRVLIVNRYSYENALMLDALTSDKRIDVRKVDLQTDEGGTGLIEAFDFADKAYDVVILGNIAAKQILAIDPTIPERLAERVKKHGMGFMMIGGHATFSGTPGQPNATGWRGVKPIEDILPVFLDQNPEKLNLAQFNDETSKFQFVPNYFSGELDPFILKVADTKDLSLNLWSQLNESDNHSRITGISNLGKPKSTAKVLAFAANERQLIDLTKSPVDKGYAPLLVVHQIGDGNNGRVLVFGAQDTMLWQRLGQPKSQEGKQLHQRFWRQLVLWLAHQDEDENAAFARPDFPRLPVGAKQGIRLGLRGKNGAVVIDPTFDVKVFAPGDTVGATRPVIADPKSGAKVNYDVGVQGEYTVRVTARGKTATGEEVVGDATAKFLAYPETSDEMLRVAADPDFMQKLSSVGGGKAYRLEDLPQYLSDMKGQPLDNVKPAPKYLPNWNRNESKGFLPIWLIVFVALLGTEWGLRRFWGMV